MKLSLASSTISFISARYYGKFFHEIIVSIDFQSRKPDEKIYRVLIARLKRYEIESQECILIDDRLNNLKTGKDLGMKTIHFKREDDSFNFHPSFTIKTLAELQIILLKTNEMK